MRTLFATLLLLALAGCHCSPATPSAVTLRVKNGTREAIFVDDTVGTLGLEVQRSVNGQWFAFDESPCACLTCASACELTCSCPDAGVQGMVRRIGPGEAVERSWSGVVQVSDAISCGGLAGIRSCLSGENAPLDETFNLRLCFASRVPGFLAPDGGRGPGEFPAVGATCVEKQFRPSDHVVETGPLRGAECATTADCKGKDELCLGGSCTSGCPGNDYPQLGSNWSLLVASPDDRGFFTATPRGAQTQLTGTGVLTAFLFQGSTMVLQLKRLGVANEPLTGAVSVGLPPGVGAPLAEGMKVSVLVVDGSASDNPSNRAVVVRDADGGAVLFAADMAQEGALLGAADLSPFAVASGGVPVGCTVEQCGRLLFYSTRFTSPSGGVELEPGSSASASSPLGTYHFLSVSNGRYADSAHCALQDVRPWAFWREKAP